MEQILAKIYTIFMNTLAYFLNEQILKKKKKSIENCFRFRLCANVYRISSTLKRMRNKREAHG